MSNFTVVVTAQDDYRALSRETKRLFDADMRELARDPYNPRGMRSVALNERDQKSREAHAAKGRVVIRYRITIIRVEVRIHTVADPGLR